MLREFYPSALETFSELAHPDCLAALGVAPTPSRARGLATRTVASSLRRSGRKRSIDRRASEIRQGLQRDQLRAARPVEDAMGSHVIALVAIATEMTQQIDRLEAELGELLDGHPDAEIIRSIPGLSTKLGARLLGEFGDAPDRFADARCRKNSAGTSPITKASGRSHVVLARRTRNVRLADACYLWAFTSISHSPGARTFYDQRRQRGDSHSRALRALANRLVGIFHGCVTHHVPYDEHTAWGHRTPAPA